MTRQQGDRQRTDATDIDANGTPERQKVNWTKRSGKDRRSDGDRRKVYDADYFAGSGVERRRGTWDRRTSRDRGLAKYRNVALESDYVYLPKIQTAVSRKKEKDRRTSSAAYFIWL